MKLMSGFSCYLLLAFTTTGLGWPSIQLLPVVRIFLGFQDVVLNIAALVGVSNVSTNSQVLVEESKLKGNS